MEKPYNTWGATQPTLMGSAMHIDPDCFPIVARMRRLPTLDNPQAAYDHMISGTGASHVRVEPDARPTSRKAGQARDDSNNGLGATTTERLINCTMHPVVP